MTSRLAFVTTSRSDYGPCYWLIHDLVAHPGIAVDLVVAGSHLSTRHGETVQEIEHDGWPIAARIPFISDNDDDAGSGETAAEALRAFFARFAAVRYDALVVYGDRYELLPIATAALLTRTPLAHICGGDVTGGAIDDQVRHALTKMAHVHFPSTPTSAARVLQMGEEPWRVHLVGDPAVDQFVRGSAADPEELAAFVGFLPGRDTLLVTLHPVTLEGDSAGVQAAELAAALIDYDGPVLLTAPGPDPGSEAIRAAWRNLCGVRPRTYHCESLGSRRYRAALRLVGAMVGNSSSALNEAPCVGLPAVNIGRRQLGREAGMNVVHCAAERTEISRAITRALSPGFRRQLDGERSLYGDGHAAPRIVEVLANLPPREQLLAKEFHWAGSS